MKILVTGGCGFIGSHVADAFINNGHTVVVVDNLSMGSLANKNEKAHFHKIDVCSPEMAAVFEAEKPDIVTHLAAHISVPESVRDPLFDAEVNIRGTIRLLELSRSQGVKKFVFSSTGGAIYGEATQVPTDETYVPEPASPYDISKMSAENYIRFYGSQYGLNYTVLRYSNVYGPRQIPHGEAGVVAIFTESLFDGKLPVVNHFPEEPRGMTRDYCYVGDIAQANLIAASEPNKGIYNIGTGLGTCTMDLHRSVVEVLREKGIEVPPAFDEPGLGAARDGDIRVSILNAGKAERELGFRAKHDLKTGLTTTIEWYLSKRQ